MAATNWDTASNLIGATNLAAADKMRQKANAALTAKGGGIGGGYTAAQLADLIAVFDSESDADTRHATLARLVAYCAAAEASSVQDRVTPAHALQKIFKDANLLLNHLYNFYGPAGLIVDRPSAELLFELEALVGAKRTDAGLPQLPGSVY